MTDALPLLLFVYVAASIFALVRRSDDLSRAEGLRRWRRLNRIILMLLALLLVGKCVYFFIDAATVPSHCLLC
jgi:hypothetical protein